MTGIGSGNEYRKKDGAQVVFLLFDRLWLHQSKHFFKLGDFFTNFSISVSVTFTSVISKINRWLQCFKIATKHILTDYFCSRLLLWQHRGRFTNTMEERLMDKMPWIRFCYRTGRDPGITNNNRGCRFNRSLATCRSFDIIWRGIYFSPFIKKNNIVEDPQYECIIIQDEVKCVSGSWSSKCASKLKPKDPRS